MKPNTDIREPSGLSYSEQGRRRRRREKIARVLVALVALALVALLVSLAYEKIVGDSRTRGAIGSWLSDDETRRLMRYHGVDALMVSDEEAKILRGGKWITVKRRPAKAGGGAGE